MSPITPSTMDKLNALRPHLSQLSDEGMSQNAPSAAAQFIDTLKANETTVTQGLSDASDPHDLVLSMAQSRIAVETIVAVRDKLVASVNDIMRMPL